MIPGLVSICALIGGVIGLLGVGLTAIVSFFIGYRTIKQLEEKTKAELLAQSSKTYKELIISERIKEIGLLRGSMIDFLGKVALIVFEKGDNSNISHNHYHEIITTSYLVKLHLDFTKESHLQLSGEINNVIGTMDDLFNNENNITPTDVGKLIAKLNVSFQMLLLKEWNDAKKEAKKLYTDTA